LEFFAEKVTVFQNPYECDTIAVVTAEASRFSCGRRVTGAGSICGKMRMCQRNGEEMKYDFTSIIDRRGQDAAAVDAAGKRVWGFEPGAPMEGFDFIPMWVADMNFKTCPAITEAIIRRAQHPLFGYFEPKDEYYESIIRWQEERNHVTGLCREQIGYENGVHGFISSVIDVLTQPGDRIFLHRPYYVGFIGDIIGKGRRPVFSDLKKDERGIWRMDYEDMDRKIRENHVRLAIFCSPHNPCGRVWTREEIERAMEVFRRNDCLVISDEIWSDLTYTGHPHVPAQMVSEWARQHVLAAYAPSKTFNLAGLVGSYHIIYNQRLNERITAFSANTHYNEMNVFSEHALIAAYSREGQAWTDELRSVLEENCCTAVDFIQENFEGVDVSMPEGTYMLFLDCTGFCRRTGRTIDEVLRAGWNVGVGWQTGRAFGGNCHIRVNLALPKTKLMEALGRMQDYIFTGAETAAYSCVGETDAGRVGTGNSDEDADRAGTGNSDEDADRAGTGNSDEDADRAGIGKLDADRTDKEDRNADTADLNGTKTDELYQDSEDFSAGWVYNDDGLLMVSDDRNRDMTVDAVKRLLGNYPVEECHLAGFVNGNIVGNKDMEEARNYCRILLNGGCRIAELFTEEECVKLRQIGIF
jgi:cystathionine beta-lyase